MAHIKKRPTNSHYPLIHYIKNLPKVAEYISCNVPKEYIKDPMKTTIPIRINKVYVPPDPKYCSANAISPVNCLRWKR